MSEKFIDIPKVGQELNEVKSDALIFSKSREIVSALCGNAMNWVEFVSCYRHSTQIDGNNQIVAETIVFDAEIELPQHRAFEIAPIERIAVTFRKEDINYPGVYALRENFPLVPHLNLELFEFPRSLCLFDEPYSELKLKWTAIEFIERIRIWLADTATGSLHKLDQTLEPLLTGSDAYLILPSEILQSDKLSSLSKIKISMNRWGENRYCFFADKTGNENTKLKKGDFLLVSLVIPPQQHGQIAHKPDNLSKLNDFLKNTGFDLLAKLRSELLNLDEYEKKTEAGLILLVVLPKNRSAGGKIESLEQWAFVCLDDENGFANITKVGVNTGAWEIINGDLGIGLIPDETKNGSDIKLLMLNPVADFSRRNASLFNGIKTNENFRRKIVAIGSGAIGSQVFLNLIRTGYGEWTLIDKDILLPHNLARHAAYGLAAGNAKSQLMAFVGNSTLESPPIANAIVADVLNPRQQNESITKAFSDSDVIMDFSASQAVARHLALDLEKQSRRVSLFLNPAGTDLIMLAEDTQREIPLDLLEMQYYRFLINNPDLENHLQPPKGKIRYSSSCREVSNQIAAENISLASAIGSRAIRQTLAQDTAVIAVWKSDESGEVKKFSVNPSSGRIFTEKDWTIRTDEFLLEKLKNLRKGKLPIETGGTLLGSFDMQRRIIYIIDTLPPPPDSIEKRTEFVRGSFGLKPQIEQIKMITLNNLQYIGEWHSHPVGYSAQPSDLDKNLLATLAQNQHQDGKPALILIIGERDFSFHIA